MSTYHTLCFLLILAEDDFTAGPQTSTFASSGGNAEMTISIPITNDEVQELEEAFLVVLEVETTNQDDADELTVSRNVSVCRIRMDGNDGECMWVVSLYFVHIIMGKVSQGFVDSSTSLFIVYSRHLYACINVYVCLIPIIFQTTVLVVPVQVHLWINDLHIIM